MEEKIKQLLGVHAKPEAPGIARIPEGSLVMDHGVPYVGLRSDKDGVVLHRMDDVNVTVSFTQTEFHERLNRPVDPLWVKPRHFTPANAKARTTGSDMLGCLGLKDQDDVLRKEFFVRSFLRREREYEEKCRQARRDGARLPDVVVSRSSDAMRPVVAEIAREWQTVQNAGSVTRPTYRNKHKKALFLPGASTVKKWIHAMEKNDFNPICLKNDYGKAREEYFTPDELVYVNSALAEACSSTRPNIAAVHRTMEKAMQDANKTRSASDQLRIPDVGTLRNRYNDVPPMFKDLGRFGKDAARREWQPEMGGIDVIRPLERVEMDDHMTDLQSILVKTGVWQTLTKPQKALVKKVRLWITAAIDVASRSVVGLHVSSLPPSIRSAMTTLEMSTRSKTSLAKRLGCSSSWPQGGLTEVFAVDSAVYFAHRPFRVAVNDCGMSLFLPPAGEAPFRGFIERWFRTAGSQMFNYFSGRTWGSIDEKAGADAVAEASMTADQVGTCLLRWVVDGYHNTPHSGLNGATPNDMWLQLTNQWGVIPGPTGELRTHCFGTIFEAVISKKGIRRAGLQFQSKQAQQIRRIVGKTPVVCRVNNHNLRSISILYESGWVDVPCVHQELAGVSIWQWLAASEKLRLFNEENAKVSRPTMLATFAWLKEQADIARLEAGILSPILTAEDFERFEKKMDRVFDVVDSPIKGEPRPEGEWHPSDELFDMLGIQPVVYASAVKAAKAAAKAAGEQAELGGRPPLSSMKPRTPREEAEIELDLDEPVTQRIVDVFDGE
ncbi:hypothetical protein [Rhizobium sp.]|uniref:hypothetical protein n=1 Tax=Rhizobium sp. TaxID=391 RepID=UPI0034C5F4A1